MVGEPKVQIIEEGVIDHEMVAIINDDGGDEMASPYSTVWNGERH